MNIIDSVPNSLVVAAFTPCAYFDERLDCIRVITRDCSYLEERVNGRVTVLVDAHSSSKRTYVGFTIKGAWHFCDEYGLNPKMAISMSSLLDALVRTSPEMLVEWFIQVVAKPLVEEAQIEQVEPELAFAA